MEKIKQTSRFTFNYLKFYTTTIHSSYNESALIVSDKHSDT